MSEQNKEREAFEAAMTTQFGEGEDFTRDAEDCYTNRSWHDAWIGWQAARASSSRADMSKIDDKIDKSEKCVDGVDTSSRAEMKIGRPIKGEVWHVRLKNAGILSTLEMLEVTHATVLVRKPGDYYETRYSRADVEFIEEQS